jgi:hypothetical protein
MCNAVQNNYIDQVTDCEFTTPKKLLKTIVRLRLLFISIRLLNEIKETCDPNRKMQKINQIHF